MRTVTRGILSFTFFSLLGVASASSASDFTFNVPVNLQNLHQDATGVYIDCRVFKTASGRTADNVVGGGGRHKTDVPVDSNGNYRGTITVSFDADRDKNPADARFYECDLNMNGGNLTSYTGNRGPVTESKPGTTRTVRVTGAIPR